MLTKRMKHDEVLCAFHPVRAEFILMKFELDQNGEATVLIDSPPFWYVVREDELEKYNNKYIQRGFKEGIIKRILNKFRNV